MRRAQVKGRCPIGAHAGGASRQRPMAAAVLTTALLCATLAAGGVDAAGPDGVSASSAITGSFLASAESSNQRAVAAYLDRLDQAGATGDLRQMLDSLASLSGAPYRAALDRLHPEAYDAQSEVLLDLAEQFARQILDRPRSCPLPAAGSRRALTRKSRCHERHQEPWISGYGAWLRRDGHSGQIDFDSNGGGVALGFDRVFFGDRLLTSASLGTGRASLDVDGTSSGSVTSMEAALYAATHFGRFEVDGLVGYGHGWHESDRRVFWAGYSRTAAARYQSNRFSGRARAGARFDWRGTRLLARTSIDYTHLEQQAFDETDPSPIGLAVRGRSDDIATFRAGLKIDRFYEKSAYWGQLLEWADGLWRPRLRLGWRQQVAGVDRTVTSNVIFASPGTGKFRVEGESADRGIEIGAGIDFTPSKANRLTLGLHYDSFLWSGISTHAFGANLRFGF